MPEGDQDLLQFPCDYVFKAFGELDGGERFRDAVLAAVSRTVPVGLDAHSQRLSSGGKFLCVSVVVRVHNRRQIEAIYLDIRSIEGLRYLL
jgi:uncharacterized protein